MTTGKLKPRMLVDCHFKASQLFDYCMSDISDPNQDLNFPKIIFIEHVPRTTCFTVSMRIVCAVHVPTSTRFKYCSGEKLMS